MQLGITRGMGERNKARYAAHALERYDAGMQWVSQRMRWDKITRRPLTVASMLSERVNDGSKHAV